MVVNTKTQTYIVDASAMLSLLLPDEQPISQLLKILQNNDDYPQLIAPDLLSYEILNSLKTAVIRKRLHQKLAKDLFQDFTQLQIQFLKPDFPKSFSLAIKHNLSIYDAVYLALSLEYKSPLISLDRKLQKLATNLHWLFIQSELNHSPVFESFQVVFIGSGDNCLLASTQIKYYLAMGRVQFGENII